MSSVGQVEKKTQQHVVKLFQQQLDYDYLGDWAERLTTPISSQSCLTSWIAYFLCTPGIMLGEPQYSRRTG